MSKKDSTPLLSMGQVAGLLGVPFYRLTYLLQVGRVPEPPRINGRRVFAPTDVERIRLALQVHTKGRSHEQ